MAGCGLRPWCTFGRTGMLSGMEGVVSGLWSLGGVVVASSVVLVMLGVHSGIEGYGGAIGGLLAGCCRHR